MAAITDEFRLGVDVGGTFTDICVFTPHRGTVRAKVPTTTPSQTIEIRNGIAKVRQILKQRYDWDGMFRFIHHGTMTATNAVLEGKGARTALVVTAGHKDILSVRRSQIPGGLGAWLYYTPPDPPVPLERVVQCTERMSVRGEPVVAVDGDALRRDLSELVKREKPEAVAVSLLNSYSNPAHEELVAKIIREHLASETQAIRVLKSDGGLTSIGLVEKFPVNILMSGPAAGAKGVADANLITLDMGGTSTDCALIWDGKPRIRRDTVVDTLSVRAPAVDIHTVGAGVGPESAGATPGPACYGKGGTDVTVTDANLILGYLPQILLGGEFALDTGAAKQTAESMINIVNKIMYGYDSRDFALVVFGEKLLSAWPILCTQGDLITKLSYKQDTSSEELRHQLERLEKHYEQTMKESYGPDWPMLLVATYEVDVRYKEQAFTISINLSRDKIHLDSQEWHRVLQEAFNTKHQQQFGYCLPDYELELMRIGVTLEDASPDVELPVVPKAETSEPSPSAMVGTQIIIMEGQEQVATVWNREKITFEGIRVEGPCIITEMDSNTLILPGYSSEIDHIGNILIQPLAEQQQLLTIHHTPETAAELMRTNPLIPTLISSSLACIRGEMDKLMLRCSMSPAIREQQDEFNVITTAEGKMLVGQFGSFITEFLGTWTGSIEEGDVFITNDTYMVQGAVSHLNGVIIILPIFHEHHLIGWASQFGHLTDVGGMVPGSMSINATSIYDDGVQIPCIKLYSRGMINSDLVDLLCRNSRQPAWYRSDLTALVTACRMAATRISELATRFGTEVYLVACRELLCRNRSGLAKIVERQFDDKLGTFTDFVDDDGHGVGPWAVTCSMQNTSGGGLKFDWSGTSPQSEHSINFYLLKTMFKMLVGYYLIAAAAPGTVINDGFHDLIEVYIPEGTVLKLVRPAAISCRTHFLGRTMDKNEAYVVAVGFSDSSYFFYSGYYPSGECDGLDCYCLFPAIKLIPTESIELNYPLWIEVNESIADSVREEISLYDDWWFTKLRDSARGRSCIGILGV
ncbi:hypothetical protein BO94DRAFT_568013 [Aspergillus sclerotioniger CBS 115572]|uniref:Hydantoinase/oxoprolinase n=1 Tax=Aspergillus sclerotioniger CBS 115572 TaxID=1450535 RepID=A0A317W1H3_9EURO|nr:hypothetical protein BO94DRAFT_568013 [Aspergillus sclerotioniger CBS 115572]PWY78010.1 hypothetical protein BO94DRAFT_568013 [Aspergillus sclerotioniger CBS 115572]